MHNVYLHRSYTKTFLSCFLFHRLFSSQSKAGKKSNFIWRKTVDTFWIWIRKARCHVITQDTKGTLARENVRTQDTLASECVSRQRMLARVHVSHVGICAHKYVRHVATWARKHTRQVSTWACKRKRHIATSARKLARHVATWARKHARNVGTWVRKNARHVGTWASKVRNLADLFSFIVELILDSTSNNNLVGEK